MSKKSWFRRWLSGKVSGARESMGSSEQVEREQSQPEQAERQQAEREDPEHSPTEGEQAECSEVEDEQAERSDSRPSESDNDNESDSPQTYPEAPHEQTDLTEFAVSHALHELSAPHPHYSGLTVEQGLAMEEHIIATSQNCFEATPEFHENTVSIDGDTVDLEPLVMRLASNKKFDEFMPTIVEEFLTRKRASTVIRKLSDLDFYRGIRVRISPIDELLSHDWALDALEDTEWIEGEAIPEYLESREFPVRPWSPSTVIRLCVKHRGIIHNLTPELLEDRDSLPELWHMGYRNLWQELVDSDLHVGSSEDLEGKPLTSLSSPHPSMVPGGELDSSCWVFQGSSSFVGSLPLFLDEFMERMLPDVDISAGMIYGTPHKNMTVVSEVGSGPSVAGSMSVVFTLTAENHGLHPSPLSTEVNVLHDGQVEPIKQVSSEHVDGGRSVRFEIQPPEYLIKRIMEGMQGGGFDDGDGRDGTDGHDDDE
ncbi:hypothetical protein GC425_08475 [Corynebacterium sp. zg254]|uniref:hypothetical protein n=1 Tax=Corynebacterium sp. zg254 TaxID=2656645 RepID=UPI002150948B|nr:hypothetical protein [Corynebacterium sp. zg254]MCR5914885.1 hypothetical protein [Corynebacterium sp. zg254]